ncbi:MAG: hypothetical protein VX772_06770 [Bacteroidota bacterium]|jgi:hypothetical protein|uniref:Uncharacterized protein n=2 Tax=Flagellimonas TaxID=444459 RepID=A0A6G7IYH4_9FLAO|nr:MULTISPECIES: hypothetical protein [Allomuricauda]MBW8245201.1 hypothetical protein [Allomuricauda oceani]MDF0708789.1 hypothetical protein [[Muricauda] okinawensis]MEC8832043.1 hypothetical protein [Bacteroidota bacterium]QII43606.1 hypothetical protein GVT53_02550 [Allomuricauda oceani]
MHKVLDKDTIEMEIVPYILLSQLGFPSIAPISEIMNAILFKMKSGG